MTRISLTVVRGLARSIRPGQLTCKNDAAWQLQDGLRLQEGLARPLMQIKHTVVTARTVRIRLCMRIIWHTLHRDTQQRRS